MDLLLLDIIHNAVWIINHNHYQRRIQEEFHNQLEHFLRLKV
jgi:hypothetical protein